VGTIDIRGNGGYIVVAPSTVNGRKYEWMRGWELEPALVAPWLKQPPPAEPSVDLVPTSDISGPYSRAALYNECEAVRAAPDGTRNTQLNESAFKVFTLVATGALDESTAITRLAYAARAAGLDETEIRSTLRSAADAGLQHPRAS
jgi:hypothetical protein